MKNSVDVVDFHAHVLPGADHGSYSVDMSRFQLESALSHGVQRIIATPHFYPNEHSVASFLRSRDAAYVRLISRLGADIPDIRLGAEVMICNGLENMPELEKLYILGTSTVLLELPFTDFQLEYVDTVYNLISRGVEVIMAHADRYPPEHITRMIEVGAKLQLNVDSLSKLIVKRHLYGWIADGHVVAIGSDIHKRDGRIYSKFEKTAAKLDKLTDAVRTESDRIWNASTPYCIEAVQADDRGMI